MKKKFRYLILALMLALTFVCGLMIPRININADMTEYLPKDSEMREGLDTMKRAFPLVDMNAPQLKVMFSGVDDVDSLGNALAARPGIATLISTRQKDSLTLYEFYGNSFADVTRIADELKQNSDVIAAETNANSNMPEGMGSLLITGVALIFVILFVMCASFVEALLFILTIGLAVIINMGTNALLPSVSMMTNTIVAVLQFVLSMDYSIILMSRFRLEKRREDGLEVDSATAMSRALRSASSSILSSSFTTIVGLLALVFMKFRIGLDLGVVLAKGVFFSLVCIYTVLPALVLIFEKWIRATEKKVLVIPTDKLAKFEVKFRWALSFIFLFLFVGAAILQSRTKLSYASIWESEIAKVFPTQTPFMVLYHTSEEDKITAVLDSVVSDLGKDSVTAVSWSSIMQRPLTAGELSALIAENAPEAGISEDNLRMLYYAWSHPKRTERMSFEDMMSLADEAGKLGLIPAGFDVESITKMFEEEEESVPEQSPVSPALSDTVAVHSDTISVEKTASAPAASDSVSLGEEGYTYENCVVLRSASEMSSFLGFSEGNARTIYTLAGRKGGSMSVAEFLDYVNRKILTNKIMRKMISQKQRQGLALATASVDSAIAAGPKAVLSDSLRTEIAQNVPDSLVQTPIGSEIAQNVPEAEPKELSAKDKLAQMAISGNKYTSRQIATALKDAEIPIDAGTVDLMFMYFGYKHSSSNPRMTLEQLLDFLQNDVLKNPAYAVFLPEGTETQIGQARTMIEEKLGALRGKDWSMAAIITQLPVESSRTFEFVERIKSLTDNAFEQRHYEIGEPVMYKEMDDGFSRELILLTILTVGSIFLIVAITFKSLVIPVLLVLSVMTGVFVNVFVSGIGGRTMLYLAYLIVQSILMGATIDYGILLTNCYKEVRRRGEKKVRAMMMAYKMAMPTIMTSGMILVLAPYVISFVMTDPSIRSILSCLSVGAASALLVILFMLPAALAACDRFVSK